MQPFPRIPRMPPHLLKTLPKCPERSKTPLRNPQWPIPPTLPKALTLATKFPRTPNLTQDAQTAPVSPDFQRASFPAPQGHLPCLEPWAVLRGHPPMLKYLLVCPPLPSQQICRWAERCFNRFPSFPPPTLFLFSPSTSLDISVTSQPTQSHCSHCHVFGMCFSVSVSVGGIFCKAG